MSEEITASNGKRRAIFIVVSFKWPRCGNNLRVCGWMNGQSKCEKESKKDGRRDRTMDGQIDRWIVEIIAEIGR